MTHGEILKGNVSKKFWYKCGSKLFDSEEFTFQLHIKVFLNFVVCCTEYLIDVTVRFSEVKIVFNKTMILEALKALMEKKIVST